LVVSAVNTYQHRYATQAAEEVLTWRLVLERVAEDDERSDVNRKLAEAEGKLKDKVRSAYRHYAYLTRRGEELEVVFARFDDDKQTSLSGNDLWGALVIAGRAVGEYFDPQEKRRKRTTLGELYLATLLDTFSRHLTLKDVVSSFYQNPQFPLVPSLEEIRRAIFALIQPAGGAGEGTGGWELVDGAGVRFLPDSPGQLAINSIQQQLRRVQPEPQQKPEPRAAAGAPQEEREQPSGGPAPQERAGVQDTADDGHAGASYSWYRLDLVNRSITDDAKRDEVRTLLRWLASKLDDDALDHQLVTLRYELNAATSEQFAADLSQRAGALDARCRIEDDE
jgi:hypothetical protein